VSTRSSSGPTCVKKSRSEAGSLASTVIAATPSPSDARAWASRCWSRPPIVTCASVPAHLRHRPARPDLGRHSGGHDLLRRRVRASMSHWEYADRGTGGFGRRESPTVEMKPPGNCFWPPASRPRP
jgi:hypothetical protein